MSAKNKAIVFDIGCVLLDWNPRYLYRKLLPNEEQIDAFFDEIGFFEWNLEFDRGRSWKDGVPALSNKFPHHRGLIEAADQRWHEMINGPIDGSVSILERMHKNNIPLYAITNFSSEKWIEAKQRFSFLNLFTDAVVSGEEGLLKPDPAIYHILFKRNGLSPEECIFIDDSKPNIDAANKLGMYGIWFQAPVQLEKELRAINVQF